MKKMIKLNNKGFTLIELLAVIVILAIILVITIPTVLNSLGTAKEQALESAIATIEDYVQQEYDKCVVGDTALTGSFNTNVISDSGSTCDLVSGLKNTASNVPVTAAGYTTNDIYTVKGDIASGEYTITAVVVGKNGKFSSVSGTVGKYTVTKQS